MRDPIYADNPASMAEQAAARAECPRDPVEVWDEWAAAVGITEISEAEAQEILRSTWVEIRVERDRLRIELIEARARQGSWMAESETQRRRGNAASQALHLAEEHVALLVSERNEAKLEVQVVQGLLEAETAKLGEVSELWAAAAMQRDALRAERDQWKREHVAHGGGSPIVEGE